MSELTAGHPANADLRPDRSYNARCPECLEEGHDTKGNHLIVFPSGAFGCVPFQGRTEQEAKHCAAVLRLAGERVT